MASEKKKRKQYDGKDGQPWKVLDANGKRVIPESFTGFKDANAAAVRFTEQTGEYAGAVRG